MYDVARADLRRYPVDIQRCVFRVRNLRVPQV